MANPDTANIVSDLIYWRDKIKGMDAFNVGPAASAMADAANALTAYEKTMAVIAAEPADLLAGRMRGLADRLDDASERCADRASKYDQGHATTTDLSLDLLARASTYQECAGLIREALK